MGGLVGYSGDGTISNSYSTGSVNGSNKVGGLVGVNWGAVSNSYSAGSVNGTNYVGGLVGINYGVTVSNSFWDTQTSGQETSSGGTEKTTEEMKNVRTFTDTSWSEGLTAPPWDFVGDPYEDEGTEDIWNIDNTGEKNNGYSFLSWQNASPNIPTLISPANGSFTSDDTPTLSAIYSDPDTGNTGTTKYRIVASSDNCLAGTVIASGASATTSSNYATTTWTPSSSIGSGGTYYWCAQNDDGVSQSAWTAMGSFKFGIQGGFFPQDRDRYSGNRQNLPSSVLSFLIEQRRAKRATLNLIWKKEPRPLELIQKAATSRQQNPLFILRGIFK